jgi:hypothetical protein
MDRGIKMRMVLNARRVPGMNNTDVRSRGTDAEYEPYHAAYISTGAVTCIGLPDGRPRTTIMMWSQKSDPILTTLSETPQTGSL